MADVVNCDFRASLRRHLLFANRGEVSYDRHMMAARNLFRLILLFPLCAVAQNRPGDSRWSTRSEIIAQHGMACTSQPLATQAALDILKQGGTALDAAITANAMLGLVEPMSCGVGGDIFAMVWDAKSKRLIGLNGSGRSPYALSFDYFSSHGITKIPSHGPLSVTVPGCVDGWFALHEKFGRLPMSTLLAPAIQYAREGFPVSEVIAGGWPKPDSELTQFPNFKETYLPAGHPPRKGEIFRNPALAESLEKIAHDGRDVFYRGDLARVIVDCLQHNGGAHSMRDFADHHSEWVKPVSTNYRGYDVWELPPNGQGIAVLQMLNILEGYDLKKMGFGSADYMHLFIEAKKLVFEDRARLYGDPEFGRIPVAELISKEYAARRRSLIRPDRAASSYEPGNPALKGDTIYLTVADREGNMVSLIQSNYQSMGSGLVPEGLGFVLHDRGEGFNVVDAGHPSAFAPHKRPFHTIIPAFVTRNGEPWMSFGVMGGDMQPQGHVQVLVNQIDFGMNTQEAGDAPRICHVGSSSVSGERMTDGGVANLENGFPKTSTAELKRRGHNLGKASAGTYGGYQAIRRDAITGTYFGASEMRKDGQAAGY
ncbi:MAG TPA: gamma-glutamyltransferase [Verrucomicrobiaceae bacterium]